MTMEAQRHLTHSTFLIFGWIVTKYWADQAGLWNVQYI